jgi:hypothetical protein
MAFALSIVPNGNQNSFLDILRCLHCGFIHKKQQMIVLAKATK